MRGQDRREKALSFGKDALAAWEVEVAEEGVEGFVVLGSGTPLEQGGAGTIVPLVPLGQATDEIGGEAARFLLDLAALGLVEAQPTLLEILGIQGLDDSPQIALADRVDALPQQDRFGGFRE